MSKMLDQFFKRRPEDDAIPLLTEIIEPTRPVEDQDAAPSTEMTAGADAAMPLSDAVQAHRERLAADAAARARTRDASPARSADTASGPSDTDTLPMQDEAALSNTERTVELPNDASFAQTPQDDGSTNIVAADDAIDAQAAVRIDESAQPAFDEDEQSVHEALLGASPYASSDSNELYIAAHDDFIAGAIADDASASPVESTTFSNDSAREPAIDRAASSNADASAASTGVEAEPNVGSTSGNSSATYAPFPEDGALPDLQSVQARLQTQASGPTPIVHPSVLRAAAAFITPRSTTSDKGMPTLAHTPSPPDALKESFAAPEGMTLEQFEEQVRESVLSSLHPRIAGAMEQRLDVAIRSALDDEIPALRERLQVAIAIAINDTVSRVISQELTRMYALRSRKKPS